MRHVRFVCRALFMVVVAIGLPGALLAIPQVKDFSLPSATDNSLIHLSDHAGKVVLINWWRTSCQWSQAEAPKLVELYKKFHSQGFDIVGISDDNTGTVTQVPSYLRRYGVTWPVGLNDQGEFMREIRPMGSGDTPGNYLVSRSGQITYLGLDRSPDTWNKLVAAVTQALAEKAIAGPAIAPRTLEPAPSMALADLTGKKTTLSSVSGKPVLVNFFNASSCDWTGGIVSKLYKDYGGRGFLVIGVDLYDNDAAIQQCKTKYGAAYPILRGDQATQQAWIGENKGWAAFFVTPDGKILKKITDSIDNGIEQAVFTKYAEYLLTRPK
ncbi:MAG TPA: TlpA disulfide reductase family protein [Candidatus Acidoferrum sp.]